MNEERGTEDKKSLSSVPRSSFIVHRFLEDEMAISRAEPGKTRIGWVGTGVMGRWMCQHLLSKGFAATVYNRTKDKAKPLLDAGAAWADTPRAVAERSDVVFAIVGFPKDVREALLVGQGSLARSRAATVLVNIKPSEPPMARAIRDTPK